MGMEQQEHELAQEIKTELHREVENLREEMEQIRNLVQDAIVKLTDSFNGLRDQSNDQQGMVTSLISSMEQKEGAESEPSGLARINIRQFVAETDRILRSFVDHILMVSRQSMEMVHRVDDLAHQMEQVGGLLKDVKTIADQTNVLALNARIVAARAGEAGKAFAVVADEVRKLSRNSNKFSDQISQVVNQSQDNIQSAKTIIENMASKDMSFAIESKGRVDEMMQEVSEIDAFTQKTLSQVSEITASINHSVAMAVMSLQFEDMVTQLTQNMERKFNMVGQFVDELCCGCLDKEGMSHQERMEAVRQILLQQQQDFDEADTKAVHQTSMDEGDIELF